MIALIIILIITLIIIYRGRQGGLIVAWRGFAVRTTKLLDKIRRSAP